MAKMKALGLKQTAQKLVPGLYGYVKRRYWNRLIREHRQMNRQEIEAELCHLYSDRMGRKLNLDNPMRYTEKIQWCKLHAMDETKSLLADKYAVRGWVAKRIGEEYLIPSLGVWESADKIDFDTLPDSFVLKTNNASGTNIIVADKAKLNVRQARKKLRRWLEFDCGLVFFESQYLRIKPLVIAEKFMTNPDGSEINDFKFTCFNGKAKFLRIDCDRHGEKHTRCMFDLDWNRLPFMEGRYDWPKDLPDKPERFDELVVLVEKLAAGFACVRVDFYVIDGRFYFGEMTFSSGGGYERIIPDEYDEILGGGGTFPWNHTRNLVGIEVHLPNVRFRWQSLAA